MLLAISWVVAPGQGQERTLVDRVYFALSTAALSIEGRSTLDAVATLMHREVEAKVHLAGHTDESGRRWSNVLLSRARADAARAYLVDAGVAPDRVSTAGHGAALPLDPHDAGRNRRVDIYVFNGSVSSDEAASDLDPGAEEHQKKL